MKDFNFILSEVPTPYDMLMHEPRFINITEGGKTYRVIIRTCDLYCSFVEYQNRYKHYPSSLWFQSEALFELTHVQSSLFE